MIRWGVASSLGQSVLPVGAAGLISESPQGGRAFGGSPARADQSSGPGVGTCVLGCCLLPTGLRALRGQEGCLARAWRTVGTQEMLSNCMEKDTLLKNGPLNSAMVCAESAPVFTWHRLGRGRGAAQAHRSLPLPSGAAGVFRRPWPSEEMRLVSPGCCVKDSGIRNPAALPPVPVPLLNLKSARTPPGSCLSSFPTPPPPYSSGP